MLSICGSIWAEEFLGFSIVCGCGFFLRKEAADSSVLPVDRDLSYPTLSISTPGNAPVSRDTPASTLLLDILRDAALAKIRSPVVQPIVVDVVDNKTSTSINELSVEVDFRTVSVGAGVPT
jgi:hypothetical protein